MAFRVSPKGTKLIAVGNAHGTNRRNLPDPERVEENEVLGQVIHKQFGESK